ncbi:unnamed protein product [Camellia sinensis]
MPLPRAEEHISYEGALRPVEGDAIAQYVQQEKRIPRRGEVGLSAEEIQKFESLGKANGSLYLAEVEERKDIKLKVEGGSVNFDLNTRGSYDFIGTSRSEMEAKTLAYRNFSRVPIVDGYSFAHLTKWMNVAGRHITSYLVDLLQRRGYAMNSTADFETVRDVKENLCYLRFQIFFEDALKYDITSGRPKLAAWIECLLNSTRNVFWLSSEHAAAVHNSNKWLDAL